MIYFEETNFLLSRCNDLRKDIMHGLPVIMVTGNNSTARNPITNHFSKHDIGGPQFIVCQVTGNHQHVTCWLVCPDVL